MEKDITAILRKYEDIGLFIRVEFINYDNMTVLLIRGKWGDKDEEYYFYNQAYPISIIMEVFHSDIEAILCDFKIRFENERKRKGWFNEKL